MAASWQLKANEVVEGAERLHVSASPDVALEHEPSIGVYWQWISPR